MDLVPWRGFDRELSLIRREMDDLWKRIFGESTGEFAPVRWAPALDVSETENEIIVKAELPGMDPKDVQVDFEGDVLTIKGEKKQEKEEKEENYHLVERSYGTFSRSFRIPKPIQEDKIKANYKNGVLKIVLPKAEEAKKKPIQIEVK